MVSGLPRRKSVGCLSEDPASVKIVGAVAERVKLTCGYYEIRRLSRDLKALVLCYSGWSSA